MAEEKKRHSRAGGQWFVMLGYLLVGIISGVLIMNCLERYIDAGASAKAALLRFVLLFLCMYAAMVLQIVIHEAGHLVFGLMTGYRFNSFRVFNLMLLKENGRLCLRKLSIAGTGGQCLMDPPDLKDGDMLFVLYNLGGAFLNLLSSLLFGGLALLCAPWSFRQTALLLLAFIGVAFALINGLPFGSGPVSNDGRNTVELAKNPEARRAFWIQMKGNVLVSRGVRVKDMPAEWFVMPSEEGMKNGMIAVVGVLACNRLMDEQRFEEAGRLIERVLREGSAVAGMHRALLTCDRMFIELIGDNRREVLDGMMTKEQKRLMKAMKQLPSVIRTEYAWALLAEKDAAKAEKLRRQFDRAAKTYPYPSEAAGERELLEIAYSRGATQAAQA